MFTLQAIRALTKWFLPRKKLIMPRVKCAILATPATMQSARLLADLVAEEVYDSADDLNESIRPPKVLLRWGNGYGRIEDVSRVATKVINKASAITLNCNKPEASDVLSDVVDVPHRYRRSIPEGVQAVLRPETHERGHDWELVTGPRVIPEGHYARKFIPVHDEYRMWYCNGQTLLARRARRPADERGANRAEWGYQFMRRPDVDLVSDTVKAFKAIGLDFGAADILHDTTNDRCYFTELNSAPALDHPNVLEFFRTHLTALINNKLETP